MKNTQLQSKLKNTLTIVTFGLLLTACGGTSSKSSANSANNNNPTNGTNPSGNALATNALSTIALTGKAIKSASAGISQSKILSTARYKATTQVIPCNGGGEQRMTTSNIDPSSGEMPTSIDFNMIFDRCKNTQNGSESFINGTLKMTIELNQSDPSASNSNYTFKISSAYFIERINKDKSERVDIKDYEVSSTGNQDKVSMEIKGSFKESSCLDQWINVKTVRPIVMLTNNTCPTAGQMSMTVSQSTTTITYNTDQSIDISGNGTSQHYDNCNDLNNIDDTNMCK
jgi:hypothetical protein